MLEYYLKILESLHRKNRLEIYILERQGQLILNPTFFIHLDI